MVSVLERVDYIILQKREEGKQKSLPMERFIINSVSVNWVSLFLVCFCRTELHCALYCYLNVSV